MAHAALCASFLPRGLEQHSDNAADFGRKGFEEIIFQTDDFRYAAGVALASGPSVELSVDAHRAVQFC